MRTSNPVLTRLEKTETRRPQYPEGFEPYAGYAPAGATTGFTQTGAAERPMTVDDFVTKTSLTLAVIVAGAVVNFFIGVFNPGTAVMLTMLGAIGGLITVMVSAFGKKTGSGAVTLTYAAFEGLFVGGFSFLVAGTVGTSSGGGLAGGLIAQAVLGTIGVFAGMLFVYKNGTVKVTPKFTKMVTAGLIGVLVLALGNLVMSLLFGMNFLYNGGPVAIVFSLVCIGLAAASFLQDFDVADRLIRAGAPASQAWGVALGLAVTLVWLYTEILRLLSYFNRN